MANKIIVLFSVTSKSPPLAKLDEEYHAELKQWMGKLYPDEPKALSKLIPEVDKENKLPCE